MNKSFTSTLLLAVGTTCLTVGVGAVSPAIAGTITNSGTTVGQPTWNRPVANGDLPPFLTSFVGTNVSFNVQDFTVSTSGSYNFLSETVEPKNWDNFLVLYQNSFNPTSPLTNAVIANDDFPTVGLAGFKNVSLNSGTNYFLVTTGFKNGDAGSFVNSITSATAIPTPALLPGLFAFGVSVWKKRKAELKEEASKV